MLHTTKIPAFTFQHTDFRPVTFFMSVPGINYYHWNLNGQTVTTFSHINIELLKIATSQYDNEYSTFCTESTRYQQLIGNM